MTMLQAQDAIVQLLDQRLAAEQPTLPVAFDNQPFDHNNPPDLYAEVEVDLQNGTEVGIGATLTRYRGFVYVEVHAREGTGSRRVREVQDWFVSKLGYAKVGPVQLEEPIPDGSKPSRGWKSWALKVPFFTDPM